MTVTPHRVIDGALTDVFDEVHEAAAAASRTMRTPWHTAANRSAVPPTLLSRTIAG
jgi:hypothetical protein